MSFESRLFIPLALTLSLGACSDDGEVGDAGDGGDAVEASFRVRIENIAPWTVLKSGLYATKTTGTAGALSSGEAFELSITAGAKQSVSFAAMLGESNDWFFAPGSAGIALYDAEGAPRSGDVTDEVMLWDAGTEVNEEPAVGASTGPQQAAPDQGAPDPDPTVRALAQTVTLSSGASFSMPAVSDMVKVTLTPKNDRVFVLRIENVSMDDTLVTSLGSRAIHVSPFVWALHIAPYPLFDEGAADRGEGLEYIAEAGRTATLAATIGELSGFHTPLSPGAYVITSGAADALYSTGLADRGEGLERIAEDGNPMLLLEAVDAEPREGEVDHGIFNTPAGLDEPGPARPGSAFEFDVTAAPGDRLAFATMFGMSNDWFFGTESAGISLFDAAGAPVYGDVTSQIAIYDAGTELDEELAIGPNTGPQQPAPDTGRVDPVAQVRPLSVIDYPRSAAAHVRVTLQPIE
jgi:hypothetical protein